MDKININESCWEKEEISTGSVEKDDQCPVCKGEAQEVKDITVRNFVNDNLVDKVKDGNYHICLSENCEVVYFNLNKDLVFNKDDIKTPIWFKRDADPKYICYCNNVTEDEIIHAIVDKNAKNMRDIIRITGAMKNAKCEINNPLSKCCGSNIQKIINNFTWFKTTILEDKKSHLGLFFYALL